MVGGGHFSVGSLLKFHSAHVIKFSSALIKPQMYVLEIGLTLLQNEYITDYGTITAGCTVALVPAMIIFIIFRSQIMEGIATSGMKN